MTADLITPAQRAALQKLAPVLAEAFYLVGGIAITARLHHRASRDLDLFSAQDPTARQVELEALGGVIVTGRSAGSLHLAVDGVPTTLLQYRYPTLDAPMLVSELPIALASTKDLVCMKLSAIGGRGLARDFWDLHALMTDAAWSLATCLELFRQKYPVEDVGHVMRSLAYFGDALSAPLPPELSPEHWSAIEHDFERWLRELIQRSPSKSGER